MATQTKRACFEIVPTSSNVIHFFFFLEVHQLLVSERVCRIMQQVGPEISVLFLSPIQSQPGSAIKSLLNLSAPTFKATIERLSKMPFHGKAIQKSSISLFHLLRSSPLLLTTNTTSSSSTLNTSFRFSNFLFSSFRQFSFWLFTWLRLGVAEYWKMKIVREWCRVERNLLTSSSRPTLNWRFDVRQRD